jgi:hypothetical protein
MNFFQIKYVKNSGKVETLEMKEKWRIKAEFTINLDFKGIFSFLMTVV